ncbi:hypothetical protein D3C86_1261400 [compost metagenome]
MNTLGLDREISVQFFLRRELIFFGKILFFDVSDFCSDVCQNEELLIFITSRHIFYTFICQIDLIVFLIDNEIKIFIYFRHITVVIRHILTFNFLKQCTVSALRQEFDQLSVFRKTSVSLQQFETAFFCITSSN